jgi:hypothetical protein
MHALIANRVYPAFLRGEYDTAIFQAFREVEVGVRAAGSFSNADHRTDLMLAAFRIVKNAGAPGPLTDITLPVGEQDAMGTFSPAHLEFIETRQVIATFPRTLRRQQRSLCLRATPSYC